MKIKYANTNMKKRLLISCAACLACLFATAQQWDNYKSSLRNRYVKISKTNLPIVFIDVGGNIIQRNTRILARMKVIDNGAGRYNYGDTVAYPNQTVDYEGYVALKYRGNSSFNNSDKKPYSFKTLKTNVLPDNGGKKKKVKLMGMTADNDWALLAPFSDKSMMRDVLTFELARPFYDFVPHARYCELILDGTYYGIFILTERPTKGKGRLNLNDPGAVDGDLTGDYHVEIDRNDDPYYPSKYHPLNGKNGSVLADKTIKYQYKDPEEEDFAELPAGTQAALNSEIDKMEDAFHASNYNEADGYRKYIDVTSFIDYMLATEFAFNIDGYRLSTGLYKYSSARANKEGSDARWKTLLWDFNIAYGNADYYNGETTNLWQYDFNSREPSDGELVPFYWYRLLDDPAYIAEMKIRWKEYRDGSYADENIVSKIDSIASLLTSCGAMERNQQAYQIIGRKVWPNYYNGSTYAAEVEYLKEWIKRRLQFMDKALLPHEQRASEPVMVKAGSYTDDIIAETLPVQTSTTAPVDRDVRSFYSAKIKAEGGLPVDRMITSSYEEIKYRLAPYDGNNVIRLQEQGKSTTIEFEKPFSTSLLYMLATSGGGTSIVNITLNYADGTSSPMTTLEIRDWSVRNPQGTEAVIGLGNINRDSDVMSTDNHYCLFDHSIQADKNKTIISATITLNNDAIASILAFSKIAEAFTDIVHVTEKETIKSCAITGIFSVSGIKQQSLQKGLNIIRYNDGTVQKVMVK